MTRSHIDRFAQVFGAIAISTMLAACGGSPEKVDTGSDSLAVKRSPESRSALVSVVLQDTGRPVKSIHACSYEVDLDADKNSMVAPISQRAYSSNYALFERKLQEAVGGVIAVGGSAVGILIIGTSVGATPVLPPAAYGIGPGLLLLGTSSIVGGGMLAGSNQKLSKANAVEHALYQMMDGTHFNAVFYDEYKERVQKAGNSWHVCQPVKAGVLQQKAQ